MKILDNKISVFLETPISDDDNADILLGLHIMEGQCENCSEPAVGIQLGLLFFTITITITKAKQ